MNAQSRSCQKLDDVVAPLYVSVFVGGNVFYVLFRNAFGNIYLRSYIAENKGLADIIA